MTFEETVILTVLDKVVIGVLLLIVGLWVNRAIEKFKAREALKSAFAPLRAAGYRELWSLTQVTSPTDEADLTEEERKQLNKSLKDWYYMNGGYMLLSLKSADLFLKAQNCLLKPEFTSQQVRDRFSALRTELKIDLGVYNPEERDVQIGREEPCA